jgi:hypothetical protein
MNLDCELPGSGPSAQQDSYYKEDIHMVDLNDVYATMLATVKQKRSESELKAFDRDYIKRRPTLVKWMLEVGACLNLAEQTIHMAVFYLDGMVSRRQVAVAKLQLAGCAAILTAAKHEEVDELVPTLTELHELCDCIYTPQHISAMEKLLLARLDWDLAILTPMHFFSAFKAQGALHLDASLERVQDRVPSPKHLIAYEKAQEECSEVFLNTILKDYRSINLEQHLIAAGCLAAARYQLKIKPVWTQRLETLTRVSESAARSCLSHVWNVRQDAENCSGSAEKSKS